MRHGHIHVAPTIAPSVIHDIGRRGWLENMALGVALVAVAVVLAGLFVARGWYRRRSGASPRRRLQRWGLIGTMGLITTTVGAAGGAIALNSYVGYVPTLSSVLSPQRVPSVLAGGRTLRLGISGHGSHVVELSIAAPSLGLGALPAYVYLPPGYSSPSNAHRRYPTLYLIHGHPGSAIDWFRAGRVERTLNILQRDHLIKPMIVVAPSASPSWLQDTECLNAVHGVQMETYLTRVVPTVINRDFRTRTGRAYTGIGGMSSGAFCALNLALRHPHVFSIVAASEPYADPGQKADRSMLASNHALIWANTPGRYLRAVRPPLAQAFFLDSGGRDRTTSTNMMRLAHELANDGQDVVIRQVPHGKHTWLTARLELPYALVFASQRFGHLPAGGSVAADARLDQQLLTMGATRPDTPPWRTPVAVSPSPAPSPSTQRSHDRSRPPSGAASALPSAPVAA